MTAASVALCSENRQLEQGKWRNQGDYTHYKKAPL